MSSVSPPSPPQSPPGLVLITGAAGKLGRLAALCLPQSSPLRLTDRHRLPYTTDHPFVPSKLEDVPSLIAACAQVHTILHLAAVPDPNATWEELLPSNVQGAYNLFEAARQTGVQRVIFASSLMAVDAYPRDIQVHADHPPAPATLYGATKVWGEALSSLYAQRYGMSVICLRLGWVLPRRRVVYLRNHPNLNMILTEEDLLRLFTAVLQAPISLRFGVFHATSNHRFKRWDISPARQLLGYAPQDDGFVLARLPISLGIKTRLVRLVRRLARALKSRSNHTP